VSELAVIDQRTGELLEPVAPMNLFGTADPRTVVARATEHANALAEVIQAKQLFKKIGPKDHVLVEAWTMLGSMLGVFPVVVWTRKLEDGWEARVEARTLAGAIVGAAEASCTRTESNWKNRDDYALRSMAQTRATSKALRGPLGFVIVLAGFNATPAEEMASERATTKRAGVISEPQRKRLFTIASEKNVSEDRLRQLVKEIAEVDSTKEIPKSKYDEIVSAVEVEDIPFA
jgi:hypothetical protein